MPSFKLLRNEALRSTLSPLTKGKASGLIRPTIAAIYITSFCNSRCNMCDFWKNDHDPNELTSEQWGVVFSRLRAFGVDYVGVNASGEMFTRPDAIEILGHIRDLGMQFGLNSNGTLFTRRRSQRLAKLKPRSITIGLDGVGDESYMITRGLKRGFSKVSRNIDYLQDAGISNISIGSVLMRENIDDWVALAEFALEKKLEGIRFTAYHDSYFNPESAPVGSQYFDEEFLSRVECEISRLLEVKRRTGIVKNSEAYLRKIGDYYRNQRSFFPAPCLQGSNRIEIDTYGNVNLCSFLTESLGNLLEKDMEEIWKSIEHQKARDAAFHGKCPRCFLSCYWEENLRLSREDFFPTLPTSIQRSMRLLGSGR